MILNDDPVLRQISYLSPDRLRLVITQAAYALASRETHIRAADTLQRTAAEIRERAKMSSMREILDDVAYRYSLDLDDLKGPRRWKHLTVARQEAMWMMRQVKRWDGLERFSYPIIAAFLGGRDHTTVIHGERAHEARLKAQGAAE